MNTEMLYILTSVGMTMYIIEVSLEYNLFLSPNSCKDLKIKVR